MIAAPIRVPGAELPRRAAPAMGADTDAELRGAGYTEERIAALRAAGVIA
jgi:crotonobetainyl-CoA:carnitine CoA-transferase CaiB-like acyl-CoA transferase